MFRRSSDWAALACAAAVALLGCDCASRVSGLRFSCNGSGSCAPGKVCLGGICTDPPPSDGGGGDAGQSDAAPPDAGPFDAGADDGGSSDAGAADGSACPEGSSCGPHGLTCHLGACACGGNGGVPEPSEVSCADGADNDCNGFSDCADPACPGKTCGAHGLACDAAGSGLCACSGNGGTPEPSEASCADGADNDCNGLADCADLSCAGKACGPSGLLCAGGGCQCSGNGGTAEPTEKSCGDGFDNDCDGLVDCEDPDCQLRACGPASVCAGVGATCTCVPSVVVFGGVGTPATTSLSGTWNAPRIAAVSDNVLRYAECTADCDTARPTFSAVILGPGGASSVLRATLADLPGGGVAMVTVGSTGAIAYGECVSGCLSAPSWSWVLLPFSSDAAAGPPALSISGTTRALLYGNPAASTPGSRYAECGGTCLAAASWTDRQVVSTSIGFASSLTLFDSGAATYRQIAGPDGFQRCTGACVTTDPWNALLPTPAPTGGPRYALGTLVPRFVYQPANEVLVWSCLSAPCATAAEWDTPLGIANGGKGNAFQLGAALDTSGNPVVVYERNSGVLHVARFGGGGWTAGSLNACGTANTNGTLPSLLLTPKDSLRLLYFDQNSLRWHAGGP